MRIDKNTTIRLGDRNIVKIKLGDVVIWQKTTEPVVGPDYLYIESLGDGNTISVKNKGDGNTDNVTPTLEYSKDKNTWNTITFDWTSGEHTTELPVKLNTGEKMYFRNDTRKFSNSSNKYISFSSSVSSNVGGDIRTLSNYLDVDNETKPQSYMFYYLFYNNKIVDASNLRLSYTTLASSCYSNMFSSCTSLTSTPELPATTLAVSCYSSMFGGCTSLTTAPSLPATTLVSYCYVNMFSGCSSLTTAPKLPATTLDSDCYNSMFRGCTSLTTAPALPATTLGHSCYNSMFNGCKSLTSAPALPATTLAPYCYNSMFNGCTSLTTAPKLPATTLSDSCYNSMFNGCKSLTSAPALPATKLVNNCYNSMFNGCKSLTSAPTLPATTLSDNCYNSMFNGCTSLTTAPALPATKLVNNCYNSMFNGCSNLNKVLTYADNISTSNCTTNWLNNVASSGTLYNAGSAVYTTDSPSGIPTGWTEVTTVPTTTSVYAVPNTFTAKSWETMPKLNYIIMGVNETGIDVPLGEQNELITIGKNTGSSTVTHTETLTYDGMDYTITINQTANDTDEPDYFYIESLGDGNTISLKNQENASYQTSHTSTLDYSTDKNTWNTITFDMTSGEHTTELPVKLNTGGKMYFRNDTGKFNGSYNNRISFSSSVSSNVGGDIRTLSNYLDVNSETKPQSYMFNSLFYNNKYIVNASNLRLSYTTLATNCYSSMFNGCTSLTTAPVLPSTTLASSCYSSMFSGCTSLTSTPELPATKLAVSCYSSMFSGCTSLTTAPVLPATTLASSCYSSMFSGCTSLTTAPELPATTLARECYSSMFRGCTSLTTAPTLHATTMGDTCYRDMFNGCTSLTTAPELPATTLANDCYSSMFVDCEKLTTAPALPATTLASSCYSSMFMRCTSLVNAPELPATTLAPDCYNWMFNGCSKLKSVTIYAKDISASNCTKEWLSYVSYSGTFNNMGFAPFSKGESGIPSGWTENIPPIQSITANPDTFTIKSYNTRVNCTSTLTITTTTGITTTHTNSATITVGENTGDTTRTLTETIPYKSSSYQVTIIQTANDVKTFSWNVVSTGTYPFQLNSNDYYESTNKGYDSSYSYATLNYEGFENLVLECINSGESNYDYGIISQPDVQLSESTSDDGATGSTNVFHNFKGQSSTNPVQLTIPSDKGSHFITIKFRKDGSSAQGNDSLQFKVIE